MSPETLARLDSDLRNRRGLAAWLRQQEQWGKTLLFATSIAHADALGVVFERAGAQVRGLHSQSREARQDILRWFRSSVGPSVLVSVGMLTEGVDLPDARTALLV